MRRIFLLVLWLTALGRQAEPCLAQTPSSSPSLEQRIKNIYAPLNKNALQSGILIHQTPVLLWPGQYDGQNVADSMALSLDRFGILYGQFRGAAEGTVLPPPSAYMERVKAPRNRRDTVPLA
jgi:hypothetical protein